MLGRRYIGLEFLYGCAKAVYSVVDIKAYIFRSERLMYVNLLSDIILTFVNALDALREIYGR